MAANLVRCERSFVSAREDYFSTPNKVDLRIKKRVILEYGEEKFLKKIN